MTNRTPAQPGTGIESLAKQAFQFIAPSKYSQLHLYLDGLKDPLVEEQTKRILFLNKSEKQLGEYYARLV